MGIPTFGFFDFLFNGGRGIRPNQVKWSEPDTELTELISSAGGLHFRDPADIFTGADLAACRTARDTYFVAPATQAVLPEYQDNDFLTIVLNPADSTDNVFETYLPGNVGVPYDKTQWIARTSAIVGNTGPKGDTGTAVDSTARTIANAAVLSASNAKDKAIANTADITANTADITDEATTRADADMALGRRIDVIPSGGGGGPGTDATARSSIATETTERKAADDVLTAAASAADTKAVAADAKAVTNASNLATEITDRSDADDVLTKAAAAADAKAVAADAKAVDNAGEISSEITNRGTAVSNEASARSTGDTNLGGRIDGNVSEITTVKGIAEAAQTASEVATLIAVETKDRTTNHNLLVEVDTAEGRARKAADVALGGRIDLLPGGGITGISTKVVNRAAYSVDSDTLETLTFDMREHEIVDVIVRTSAVTSTGTAPSLSIELDTALLISYSGSSQVFSPTSNTVSIKQYAVLATASGEVTVKLLRNHAENLEITFGTLEIFLVRASGGGGVTDQGARDAASTAQTAADAAQTLADANKVKADANTAGIGALPTPTTTFSALTDTPLAIVADKFVKSNSAGDALEYVDPPSGGSTTGLSDEVTARTKGDTDLGIRITGNTTAITNEATARENADDAAAVITNSTALAGTQETLTRRAEDVALGVRIDNIGVGGGGGKVIIDIAKVFSVNNRLLSLKDTVAVPKTGIIKVEVHAVDAAFSGSFAIPAEEFLTKVGAVNDDANQGANKGFSFSMGQNRAFHISHRLDARGVPRFLAGSSDNQSAKSGDDQGWNITITHITGNGLTDRSVIESQLATGVAAKLNYSPVYSPGPDHFRFVGSDRKAAVAARDKYFLGETALTQAYVDIFSIKTSSYIRVTLDRSVIEQTGADGNDWNLVLGTDHTNTAVSITPNTPAKTFTLRLPDAGITLDSLAADLDGNSRLHAQVAGNGSFLVDYDATWGSNPSVGSVSPFRHGGDQSTIERTEWRAEYIANPNFVLVLAYGILEEYQHWAVAVAPAVSDWETVLTLIDPPTPNYEPGPTPNIFRGANRAAAVLARDKYLDSVSGMTQAFTRIYSDADNYITVSLNASVAKGPKGNKWSMRWGGDSSSAGEIELETFDSLFRAILKWDVNATTLAGLHTEFSGDSKFSSTVTGDGALVASITETFGTDEIGNTIFFQGGSRTHINIPHTWFVHYVDNSAATITLEYDSRQEMQVWDVPSIDFRTAFTLLDSPSRPNPFTVLTHDDTDPETYQWTAVAGATETELIQRTGGSVTAPVRGTVRPVIPATGKEIWVRLSKGGNDINTVEMDELILPNGDKADSQVEFRLGVSGIHLRINSTGHLFIRRTTGVSGTVTVGCDIWYR